MCDITNRNFNEKYQDIVKDISSADFIALDCEFSGLLKHEKYKISLFDNPSERYDKLRKGINEFLILQIGISVFSYNRDEKYEVSTYTFYLVPRGYSCPYTVFSCESRCIQFLCSHNFDFNKAFYDGITFESAANENLIRKEIENGNLLRKVKSEMNAEERELIQSFCSRVILWRTTAKDGATIVLNVSEIDPFVKYVIRNEIETQNSDVIVTQDDGGELTVRKLSALDRKPIKEDAQKDDLFDLVFGFTNIIKAIAYAKKPIVGHNNLMDLLMIFKMFIAPLPVDYNEFKRNITKLFPTVYDTKFISYRLRSMLGGKDLWGCNTLKHLYKFFKERGGTLVLGMPIIQDKSFSSSENFHDSGFDSYCTGYVFLKMMHMITMWDEFNKSFKSVSLGNGPVLYFSAARSFKNRINLMRNQTGYIALDGPDPFIGDPNLILVESTGKNLDLKKLTEAISKYDNADIRQVNSSQALIASSNEMTSKLIYRHFIRDSSVRLSKYKPKKFDRIGKVLTVIAVLGVGGFAFCLSRRNINVINPPWPWTT